jgi:hypothetical protein
MMAVVAVFEAWQNLTNWMHTRYNSYLIPLAIIVLIEAYIHFDRAPGKLEKRLTVLGFTFLSLFALFTAAIPYGANWIDAPDFKAHIDNLVISSIAIVSAIALGLWWLWNTKIPVLVGIVFMVGMSIFSGTHISNFLQTSFGQDTTYDHLGRFLRDFIPQDELDQTVLVGDNHTNMERALFGTLSGGAKLIQVGEAGFTAAELGPEVRWLVKVGEPIIQGLGTPHVLGTGFALFSLNEANNLDPKNNDVLSTSQFCSDQVWSCGNQVDLTLSKSESPFVVDLVIEVSEVASRGNLEFVMGEKVLTGQLPGGAFALSLNFTNEPEVGVLTVRAAADSEAASSGQSDQFVRIISANVAKR